MTSTEEVRVPSACTLPSVERPLRRAEFDELFTQALNAQTRVSPQLLRWSLKPNAEASVRDLTARETQCCSFFTFTFTSDGDALQLAVRVPRERIEVLDALAQCAAARMETR
jgi:hypothetical protein